MAQYVEIPKDFDEIKRKVALGLTKRQLICFGIAAGIGGITFFLTYPKLGITGAAYCLFITAAPAIIFGIWKPNDLWLEEHLKLMYEYYKGGKIKTYQTENIFDKIEKAMEYRRLKRTVDYYERGRISGSKRK